MTTGVLFDPYVFIADANGAPLSGGKCYTYATGGLTPQTAYTTSACSVAHANPVIASSGGTFPPIYFDQSLAYRVIFKTAAGTTLTNGDIDPVYAAVPTANIATANLQNGAVTAPKMASGAAVSNIGYTPLNKAGDTVTGNLRSTYTGTTTTDSVGFRGAPYRTEDAAYSFVVDDIGRCIRHTSGSAHTWTLNAYHATNYPWVDSSPIMLVNAGSGAVTISRSGVVLRLGGTDQNVTLSQYGVATLIRIDTDIWIITGSGLS